MLILALETSSQAGSVALLECRDPAPPGHWEGDAPSEPQVRLDASASASCANVLSQRLLAADQRSAQTLTPAMAEVLADAGRKAGDVELVAVTVGPGSFTGLRVGVTAAKTFAYATGCQCSGVDTLEVIAEQASGQPSASGEVHAVLDAQRKELFLARFRWQEGALVRLEDNRIVPVESWLAGLAPGTVVTGGGIDRLIDRLPPGAIAVPPHLGQPQAIMVGKLAWRQFQAGRRDDLWKLAPQYLRPSAAEEKVGQASRLPRLSR